MDFITDLPLVNGYNSILVIVDHLSKYIILIPTTKEKELTKLLLNVFAHHGVPEHITSDRGSVFISHFMLALGKLLDIQLHFTAGYHPEADGQTEQMNQTLEQFVRTYCTYQQDNWDQLLPLARIALNSAESTATGVTPFFANKGYHPQFGFSGAKDVNSKLALDFAVTLESLSEFLQAQLIKSQEAMRRNTDHHLQDTPEFKIGEKAYISAEFIKTTQPTKKFTKVQFRPFKIVGRPNPNSVTLQLPRYLAGIHPIFLVCQVEPYIPAENIPN